MFRRPLWPHSKGVIMKDYQEYDGQDPETSSADDATIEQVNLIAQDLGNESDSLIIQRSITLGFVPSMIQSI